MSHAGLQKTIDQDFPRSVEVRVASRPSRLHGARVRSVSDRRDLRRRCRRRGLFNDVLLRAGIVLAVTDGSCVLHDHHRRAARQDRLDSLLREARWDAVVLQDRSRLPAGCLRRPRALDASCGAPCTPGSHAPALARSCSGPGATATPAAHDPRPHRIGTVDREGHSRPPSDRRRRPWWPAAESGAHVLRVRATDNTVTTSAGVSTRVRGLFRLTVLCHRRCERMV